MGTAASAVKVFGTEKLVPALAGAGQSVNSFAQTRLGPAVAGAAVAIGLASGKDQVLSAMADTGNWCKENLGSAAKYAVSVVTFPTLGTVSVSTLWAFGFDGNGIRAGMFRPSSFRENIRSAMNKRVVLPACWPAHDAIGSTAAVFQLTSGGIAARSRFANLQSAAMGGYGRFAVNGAVSACSAVSGGVVRYIRYRKSTGGVS
ncbi:hypothetical protein BUE80_DR000898 [Diplocarpon rosae]|nr:hypothetical protein BUE80_DR000898 [Diplocarpon rosae]